MHDRDDPYVILGISPSSDAKVINDAYRKLALQCHPDTVNKNTNTTNTTDNNNANKTFDRITQAREKALRRATGGKGGGYASSNSWREATRHSDFKGGGGGENFYQKYDHLYERRRHPMHVGRQYGGGVLLLWSLSLVTFGSFLWQILRAEHKVGPATEKRREKRRKEEFANREKAREIGRMERGSTSGKSARKKKEKVVPEMMTMMGNSRHVARLDDGGLLFVEDEEDGEEKFNRKGYYETTTKFKRVKPFVSKHAERTKANALAQKNLSEEDIEKALIQMRTMEREIECCAKCGWPLPYQSTMSCPACGARTIQKRDVVRVVINKKQQPENGTTEEQQSSSRAAEVKETSSDDDLPNTSTHSETTHSKNREAAAGRASSPAS